MPNWISNTVEVYTASKADDQKIYKSIVNKNKEIDFSILIPEPFEWVGEKFGGNLSMMKAMKDNKEFDWYSWRWDNWGTKWNASDYNGEAEGNGVYWFQTAWSMPMPWVIALSKKFPESEVYVTYYDEDYGSNFGQFSMIDGKPKGYVINQLDDAADEQEFNEWVEVLYEVAGKDYSKPKWNDGEVEWVDENE